MREIKFRAWHKEEQRMLFNIQNMYDNLGRASGQECFDVDCFGCFLNNGIFEVMQYTGLKDKNGVEVYEGDIVSAHYFYFDGNHDADGEFIGEVEFSSWGTFLITRPIGNSKKCEIMEFIDTSHFQEPCIQVLGNIYENPELVK